MILHATSILKFICGASGSGKSFLMNAILTSCLRDVEKTRICIFDVGGSYRKIIDATGGKCTTLNSSEAKALIANFFAIYPVSSARIYRTIIETLCGSGPHLTHSHLVAINDLLAEVEGGKLRIQTLISNASKRTERFYLDIAHWLKPHLDLDDALERPDLIDLIRAPDEFYLLQSESNARPN